jgi:hypothetical protein
MTRAPAILLALAVLSAPGVSAQAPMGQVGADALVVTVGMTLTPLRHLEFGSIPLGVPTTVLPTAANAGEWEVIGAGNAFVSISFTLPAALSNTQAVPGVTMPIVFAGTGALWRRAVNDPAGATVFNPLVGATGRFGPPSNPTLYIWVGGTVLPTPTQLPGIYTGTVVLQLAYL